MRKKTTFLKETTLNIIEDKKKVQRKEESNSKQKTKTLSLDKFKAPFTTSIYKGHGIQIL